MNRLLRTNAEDFRPTPYVRRIYYKVRTLLQKNNTVFFVRRKKSYLLCLPNVSASAKRKRTKIKEVHISPHVQVLKARPEVFLCGKQIYLLRNSGIYFFLISKVREKGAGITVSPSTV